jgi:hypothetical protein
VGCCNSCDEGHECEGGKAPCGEVPAGVIIPRELDLQPVIEAPAATKREMEDSGPFAQLRSGKAIPVNSRLKIGQSEATASEPLSVGSCPQGSVDLVVFVLNSLTSIEAVLQGGFDAENWVPISSTVFTSTGYARFRFERVAFRYLRLYYTAAGSAGGVGVVATTLNGSRN